MPFEPRIAFLLACCCFVLVPVCGSTHAQGSTLSYHTRAEGLKLAAAVRNAAVISRDDGINLRNEVDLLYAGDHAYSTQAAKVRLVSDQPILVLEDIEHLLSSVECKPGSIVLSKAPYTQSFAPITLPTLDGGHVVTSHDGCNGDGGRQAYRIISVNATSPSTIILEVEPQQWREAFTSMNIQMDQRVTRHELRSHAKVRRALQSRQFASPSAAANLSTIPSLTTPALPSSTPTGSSHPFDLSNSIINEAFDFPGTPFQLGCVDCTTAGAAVIQFANFDIDDDGVTGTATLAVQGLRAHIELLTAVQDSWDFSVQMHGLSYALELTDFASVEFLYADVIAGGFEMDGDVRMSYGFDMSVPDNSFVTLNAGNPSASVMNGFQRTSISPLPVNSRTTIQDLDLWLALRHIISISLQVGDSSIGSAGVYVDTPIVRANITPLANVDVNCQPVASSSSSNDGGDILQDPIRVDMDAGLDFGAFVEVPTAEIDEQIFQPSNFVALAPMCLDFDQEAGEYLRVDDGASESSSSSSAVSLRESGIAVAVMLTAGLVVAAAMMML